MQFNSNSFLVIAYPAYKEGVYRGFIKGGAIEMYGLTLGVQAIGKCLLDEMAQLGVSIHFNSEVIRIERNAVGMVKGIILKGENELIQSNHYIFHTGAFAGPELFDNIPQAHNKLAAVEGYWITIKGANNLLAAMGDKPNKVHGKKSLVEILDMLDTASAEEYCARFSQFGISKSQLATIAPIVDFNNMPIRINGNANLGVGSGYIFKGLAERDTSNKAAFTNNELSDQFTLTVMELWLEALHGKKLLNEATKIVIHPKGCKRSWTPNDRELDVNLPTLSGGLCMIHDGGNTGSTTKSPFIAEYALKKIAYSHNIEHGFHNLRYSLGKTEEEVGPEHWEKLDKELDKAVTEAKNQTHQRL